MSLNRGVTHLLPPLKNTQLRPWKFIYHIISKSVIFDSLKMLCQETLNIDLLARNNRTGLLCILLAYQSKCIYFSLNVSCQFSWHRFKYQIELNVWCFVYDNPQWFMNNLLWLCFRSNLCTFWYLRYKKYVMYVYQYN